MFRTGFCIGLTIWIGCCSIASAQPMMSAKHIANFSRPVFALTAPGDPDRLYVVRQGGAVNNGALVHIVDLNTGMTNPVEFLKLTGEATLFNERGIMGMAFHPDYQNNGLFYVNYTTVDVGDEISTSVIEFSRKTADLADPASARTLMTIIQPDFHHNFGWMGFGPNDGYLYMATGDGGTGFATNAQDITDNLYGKILRIDPLGNNSANGQYGIPASNPFVGIIGDDEIWAYGFRNPWRASFDRQTGDLYIGDVGAGNREEVNVQPAAGAGGDNYGWNVREGTFGSPLAGAIDPIYDFEHGAGPLQGNVVIGGYVYRGPIAALQGHYIFADFRFSSIWSMKWDGGDPAMNNGTNFTEFIDWTDNITLDAGNIDRISSFAEDSQGNLYILSFFTGDIFRIDSVSISEPVFPVSFAVDLGSVNSGGQPELLDSDDQYLVVDPQFMLNRYQLIFTVDATSPTDTPSALEFTIEAKSLDLVETMVTQNIELFNYATGQFETVDTRVSSSTDNIVTVTASGDPTRFVQSTTNSMQARISYQNSLPFWVFDTQNLYLPFRASADHIFWTITP